MRHRQTKGPETDRPNLNHRVTSRLYNLFLCQGTASQVAEKLESLMVLSGHGFIRAAKLQETCWGFSP